MRFSLLENRSNTARGALAAEDVFCQFGWRDRPVGVHSMFSAECCVACKFDQSPDFFMALSWCLLSSCAGTASALRQHSPNRPVFWYVALMWSPCCVHSVKLVEVRSPKAGRSCDTDLDCATTDETGRTGSCTCKAQWHSICQHVTVSELCFEKGMVGQR